MSLRELLVRPPKCALRREEPQACLLPLDIGHITPVVRLTFFPHPRNGKHGIVDPLVFISSGLEIISEGLSRQQWSLITLDDRIWRMIDRYPRSTGQSFVVFRHHVGRLTQPAPVINPAILIERTTNDRGTHCLLAERAQHCGRRNIGK